MKKRRLTDRDGREWQIWHEGGVSVRAGETRPQTDSPVWVLRLGDKEYGLTNATGGGAEHLTEAELQRLVDAALGT